MGLQTRDRLLLAGGILRDLLLGDTPPPALVRWEYIVVPLAAAPVALAVHPELERLTRTFLSFDAAGLGLFCVAGTVKALAHGLAPVAAATLGATTAVGGGVLRDVSPAKSPPSSVPTPSSMPRRQSPERSPSPSPGARRLRPDGRAVAAAAMFGIRSLALHRHWRGPRAWRR